MFSQNSDPFSGEKRNSPLITFIPKNPGHGGDASFDTFSIL